MRQFAGIALLCLAAASAQTPPNPILNTQQANELYARGLQLMEAASVSMPEMNRAGAPLVENARQAAGDIKQRAANLGFTYTYLVNLRAFMTLADSIPKSFPFPAEASRQLSELRDLLTRVESHFRSLLVQRESQLRSPDRDNLRRYADANQKLGPPQAGRPRVVFFGDSITDAWHLNQYFPEQDYVNRGISGQITGEMLGRFKADVIDLKPQAVLILAGTNDLARGINIIAIENNYAMMADLADQHKIKMIFATVLPVSDYHKDVNPAYEMTAIRPPVLIRALNDYLKSLCEQRGYTYLDYYTATADGSGMLKADLADDGLHPNGAGYRVMAPLAIDAIQRTVAVPVVIQQPKPKKRRLLSK